MLHIKVVLITSNGEVVLLKRVQFSLTPDCMARSRTNSVAVAKADPGKRELSVDFLPGWKYLSSGMQNTRHK